VAERDRQGCGLFLSLFIWIINNIFFVDIIYIFSIFFWSCSRNSSTTETKWIAPI